MHVRRNRRTPTLPRLSVENSVSFPSTKLVEDVRIVFLAPFVVVISRRVVAMTATYARACLSKEGRLTLTAGMTTTLPLPLS